MTAVRFATSGTTGSPVAWLRGEDQLVAETRLLAGLLGGSPDGTDLDAICTHAPVGHLYGHLLGHRLPALLDVPVRQVPVTEPFDVSGARHPLLVTLPASFSVLARSLSTLDQCARVTIVFSSAAIPPLAHPVVAALGDRARLVELFGSTETGLVATRVFPTSDWTLAPDVRFVPRLLAARAGRLAIESPRLAARNSWPAPAEITLDDEVTVVGANTFRWHGRAGRLVKVNGRRLNLDAVRATLSAAAPDAAVRCVPEPDQVRGEWFTVTVDSADPATLRAVDRAVATLPAWQRPRAVQQTTAARIS